MTASPSRTSKLGIRFELDDRGGSVAQLAEHPGAARTFQDKPRRDAAPSAA